MAYYTTSIFAECSNSDENWYSIQLLGVEHDLFWALFSSNQAQFWRGIFWIEHDVFCETSQPVWGILDYPGCPKLGCVHFIPYIPGWMNYFGVQNICGFLLSGYKTFCMLNCGGTKHFSAPGKIGVRNIYSQKSPLAKTYFDPILVFLRSKTRPVKCSVDTRSIGCCSLIACWRGDYLMKIFGKVPQSQVPCSTNFFIWHTFDTFFIWHINRHFQIAMCQICWPWLRRPEIDNFSTFFMDILIISISKKMMNNDKSFWDVHVSPLLGLSFLWVHLR